LSIETWRLSRASDRSVLSLRKTIEIRAKTAILRRAQLKDYRAGKVNDTAARLMIGR
jgi:hypothetical protein